MQIQLGEAHKHRHWNFQSLDLPPSRQQACCLTIGKTDRERRDVECELISKYNSQCNARVSLTLRSLPSNYVGILWQRFT